jgi:hypothetical protein
MAVFPSPVTCKAKIAHGNLYYCLMELHSLCPYVFKVGANVFCKHPSNTSFANRN